MLYQPLTVLYFLVLRHVSIPTTRFEAADGAPNSVALLFNFTRGPCDVQRPSNHCHFYQLITVTLLLCAIWFSRYVSHWYDKDEAPGTRAKTGQAQRTDKISRHAARPLENNPRRGIPSPLQRVGNPILQWGFYMHHSKEGDCLWCWKWCNNSRPISP